MGWALESFLPNGVPRFRIVIMQVGIVGSTCSIDSWTRDRYLKPKSGIRVYWSGFLRRVWGFLRAEVHWHPAEP